MNKGFLKTEGAKKGTSLKVPKIVSCGVGGIRTLVQTSNT